MAMPRIEMISAVCLVAFVAAFTVLRPGHGAEDVQLTLDTNKRTYLVGEPILMRVTLRTGNGSRFSVYDGFYLTSEDQGSGFSLHVAGLEGPFSNLFTGRHPFPPFSHVPLSYPYFNDRHGFPKTLEEKGIFARIDIFAAERPGTYRLKASLSDGRNRRLESKEVVVDVRPLADAKDSIARVVAPDVAVRLGPSIATIHYLDGRVTGIAGGLSERQFLPLESEVLEKCPDSVSYPYVLYARILRDRDTGRGGLQRHPLATKEAVQMAEEFLKKYPESWLAPEVMRVLFWTYLLDGEKYKAVEIGKKALALDPLPTVIINSGVKTEMEKLTAPPK